MLAFRSRFGLTTHFACQVERQGEELQELTSKLAAAQGETRSLNTKVGQCLRD